MALSQAARLTRCAPPHRPFVPASRASRPLQRAGAHWRSSPTLPRERGRARPRPFSPTFAGPCATQLLPENPVDRLERVRSSRRPRRGSPGQQFAAILAQAAPRRGSAAVPVLVRVGPARERGAADPRRGSGLARDDERVTGSWARAGGGAPCCWTSPTLVRDSARLLEKDGLHPRAAVSG
jgi:hypothetical protein